jgi:hypothetical protein
MNKNEPPHMAESKSNAHRSFAFIPLSPLLLLALSIGQKQQKNYPILALLIKVCEQPDANEHERETNAHHKGGKFFS